jgi:hypothetical protein
MKKVKQRHTQNPRMSPQNHAQALNVCLKRRASSNHKGINMWLPRVPPRQV